MREKNLRNVSLSKFIVIANLACQLDWTDQCLENWQNTLLGVSMRVFPEVIGMWVRALIGKDQLWTWAASSNRLRAWKEQKCSRMGKLACGHALNPYLSRCGFCCWHCPVTLQRAFKPSASDWGCIIALLVLRLLASSTEQLLGFLLSNLQMAIVWPFSLWLCEPI
jgi:hypothetical protein